jgi:hypothetical protein
MVIVEVRDLMFSGLRFMLFFTLRLFCRLFVNSLDSSFRAYELLGLGILSGRFLQVLEPEWEEWKVYIVKRRIKT